MDGDTEATRSCDLRRVEEYARDGSAHGGFDLTVFRVNIREAWMGWISCVPQRSTAGSG